VRYFFEDDDFLSIGFYSTLEEILGGLSQRRFCEGNFSAEQLDFGVRGGAE